MHQFNNFKTSNEFCFDKQFIDIKSSPKMDGFETGSPSKVFPINPFNARNVKLKQRNASSIVNIRNYISSTPSSRTELINQANCDQKLAYLINRSKNMKRTSILTQKNSGFDFKFNRNESPFNKPFTCNTESNVCNLLKFII